MEKAPASCSPACCELDSYHCRFKDATKYSVQNTLHKFKLTGKHGSIVDSLRKENPRDLTKHSKTVAFALKCL